jgi:hypothetical protein
MELLKQLLEELKNKVEELKELNEKTKDGQNKDLIPLFNKEMAKVEAIIEELKYELGLEDTSVELKEFGYELPDGRIVDIQAHTEDGANQKLLDFLLDNGYVQALGKVTKIVRY